MQSSPRVFPAIIIALAATAHAQTPPPVEIMPWQNGKQAALVMMFDDNLKSQQVNAVPELEKRKFQATFFPTPAKYGFDQTPFWQVDLPKLGHAYGVHSMTHRCANEAAAEEEIKQSAEILRRINASSTTSPLMSFARPGGKGAFEVSREAEAALLKKYQLVSRDSGLFMYVGQSSAELENWLKTLLVQKREGRICFHGVGGDYIPVTMEVFVPFLDAVAAKQDQLWIASHIRVHKYTTEFATAKTQVVKSNTKAMLISLTTEADPTLYDEPLTLRAKVPPTWKTCSITQGSRKSTTTITDGVAQFDALPGATPILLQN